MSLAAISIIFYVAMVVVFMVVFILAHYLNRWRISDYIDKEFDVVFECFDKEDTTSRDILDVLMNHTKYVRDMKGIEEVYKHLSSCHRMRAFAKLSNIELNWEEYGFKVLDRFVY